MAENLHQPEERPKFSIIIPAYNEARRLAATLDSIVGYFENRPGKYEIIVVDDGSSDKTGELAADYSRRFPSIRLLGYPRNRGKGFAVRFGMLNAAGDLLLFDDADGSTPIEELSRLERAIAAGADVAIGSRAKHSNETAVKALWYRKLLGRTFNFLVNTLIVPDIADTQCGFKMFTRAAAGSVFSRQMAEGFSFDVEILFLSRKSGLVIAEIPVNWHNVPGSKVNLALDSLRMLFDIFRFRWNYLRGRYRQTI